MLAISFSHAGQRASADGHAARCADLLDSLLDGELSEALEVALWVAWAEIHVERHADAVRHLSRALPLAGAPLAADLRSALAAARVGTGELDLDEAARWPEAVPGRHDYALLARARTLAAQGEERQAAHLAGEAAGRFAATGARMYEAQARLLAGSAQADAGELTKAKALFESCGSPRFAELAMVELRRLGPRRTRGSADSADLTVREREVALLVGEGLTNQQIAGQLRLSVKTVETHLGKVFRKAGVTNRSSLVTTLAGQPRT